MDYACAVWRFAACTYARKQQLLQSKCLRLVTGALCYISGKQNCEDLGVPLFVDNIRALTACLDSNLAEVRNPLVR